MSPCEAIAVILDNDSDVTTLRSDRFYIGLNMVPSGKERPYQYCDQRDVEEIRHMTGRTGFANVVFEIENYADDPATCQNLALATRGALDQFKGVVVDDAEEFDIKYIKLDDESHVVPVPIPGRESALAVIRQSYRMMYFRNPATV